MRILSAMIQLGAHPSAGTSLQPMEGQLVWIEEKQEATPP